MFLKINERVYKSEIGIGNFKGEFKMSKVNMGFGFSGVVDSLLTPDVDIDSIDNNNILSLLSRDKEELINQFKKFVCEKNPSLRGIENLIWIDGEDRICCNQKMVNIVSSLMREFDNFLKGVEGDIELLEIDTQKRGFTEDYLSNFRKRLNEFLNSECDDYDIGYEIEEDMNEDEFSSVDVKIKRFENEIYINFKYDSMKNDLKLELSDDSYYTVREFDYTVKYFWMLVSPVLFLFKREGEK